MTKKKTRPAPAEEPVEEVQPEPKVQAEPVPEGVPAEQAPEQEPAEEPVEVPQKPQADEPGHDKPDRVVVRCDAEQALLQGRMMRKGWRRIVPYGIYEQAARANPGAFTLVGKAGA